MKRRRQGEASESVPGSGWAVTYADLVTLLFAFFVLLVSMSAPDVKRLQKAFHNFQSAAGMMYFKDFRRSSNGRDVLGSDIKNLLKEVQQACGSEIRDSGEVGDFATESFHNEPGFSPKAIWINAHRSENSFSMIVSSGMLFEGTSAALNGNAHALLEKIGAFLHKQDYRANIDVYTGTSGSSDKAYPTPDALALAQAQALLDCLMLRSNVEPKRLAMGGYGNSPLLQAGSIPHPGIANDRVEIVFEKVAR